MYNLQYEFLAQTEALAVLMSLRLCVCGTSLSRALNPYHHVRLYLA